MNLAHTMLLKGYFANQDTFSRLTVVYYMTLEAALPMGGQPGLAPSPAPADGPHNVTGQEGEGESIRIFFGVNCCAATEPSLESLSIVLV